MGWSGQEDGMDVMKEIIQKEIQSISSLEERVIFKNLMEGVFLSLYDTNREMYEGLERRIKEELDYDKNRYYVKTGIVEREFFDASHHLLSPMDESDLAEKLYGNHLKFHFRAKDVNDLLDKISIYSPEEKNRVRDILLSQMKKYAYLFE